MTTATTVTETEATTETVAGVPSAGTLPVEAFNAHAETVDASASLLVDGLGDDSVRARSYELTFTRRPDGTWRIESATWAQRCHEGRGHQDLSPEPCL